MPPRCASLVSVVATLATFSLACVRGAAPSPPVSSACPEPTHAASEAPSTTAHSSADPTPPSPVSVATAPADPSAHDMAKVLRAANTPPELTERGATAHIWDDHEIDSSINPFYLRADFDGDGRPDYLVSVVPKAAPAGPSDPRLLVLRDIEGKSAVVWLEDDAELSLPARDGWYVHGRRTKVPVGFDGTKPPKLVGDAFVMMKAESSSALVYWTGKRFASHWLSD